MKEVALKSTSQSSSQNDGCLGFIAKFPSSCLGHMTTITAEALAQGFFFRNVESAAEAGVSETDRILAGRPVLLSSQGFEIVVAEIGIVSSSQSLSMTTTLQTIDKSVLCTSAKGWNEVGGESWAGQWQILLASVTELSSIISWLC